MTPVPSTRPQLARDALRNMGRIVAAAQITLLGASYREDVGDTRYSGSEVIGSLLILQVTMPQIDPQVQADDHLLMS